MRPFACAVVALLAIAPARLSAGVERWTPLGPDEGVVLSLAVDPQNPDVVYAGTRTAGVFRSADGGKTWVPARHGLLFARIDCLAIDLQTPSTLYAGTPVGVFKSTNRGVSWEAAGAAYTLVASLAIDPQDPQTIFAATRFGVYRSRNAAAAWEQLAGRLPEGPFQTVLVDPDRPRIVYVLHAGGRVFRSADGGESWAMRSPRPSPVTVLAMDPLRPAILYAETAGMLYTTFDGGTSWSRVREPGYDISDNLHLAVASLADRSTLYAGSAGGVWRSDDGGQTWKYLDAPGESATTALATAPGSQTVFAANMFGGLARSGDLGNNWVTANEGLSASPVLGLALDPSTPTDLYVMAGTAGEDYLGRYSLNESRARVSREGGATWDELRPGWSGESFHGPLCFDPGDPRRLFLVENEAILSLPLDRQAEAKWIDGPAGSGCWITFLAPDPAAPEIVYAGTLAAQEQCAQTCDSFRSADGGASWSCLGLGRPLAVAFDPLRPARRYLSTMGGLFVTDDGGDTWRSATATPAGAPTSLLIPPGAPDLLYAGAATGVFLSRDGAVTWESTGALPQGGFTALAADPRSPSRLYAGAGSGVFGSEDGGATWFDMSEGLVPGTFTAPLVVDPQRPRRLYAGTRAGLFAWTWREPTTCVGGAETLCLAGRFQVRLRWNAKNGRYQPGRAIQDSFFALGRAEPEVAVKVVPAAAGGFATLYVAGVSDREYRVDVLDTATGDFRTYFKGAGQLSSRRDVRAFPAAPEPAAAKPEPARVAPRSALLLARFQVEVAWQRRGDGSGAAYARSLASPAAVFGFTRRDDVDVLVHVGDRRRHNGHFWVSFAGLTTAGYTVRVTDILTGAVRTYQSPQGKLTSFQDREAF